jgi:hypothetical protein
MPSMVGSFGAVEEVITEHPESVRIQNIIMLRMEMVPGLEISVFPITPSLFLNFVLPCPQYPKKKGGCPSIVQYLTWMTVNVVSNRIGQGMQ